MSIGIMIAKERVKRNLTRGQLAIKVGCSDKAIEYWEKGQRKISLENADKVFKALNIKLTIGVNGNYEQ